MADAKLRALANDWLAEAKALLSYRRQDHSALAEQMKRHARGVAEGYRRCANELLRRLGD